MRRPLKGPSEQDRMDQAEGMVLLLLTPLVHEESDSDSFCGCEYQIPLCALLSTLCVYPLAARCCFASLCPTTQDLLSRTIINLE